MSDPRKEVKQLSADEGKAIRDIAQAVMLRATEEGASALGITGASFTLLGLGVWIQEWSELNPRATSKMLRALADLYDPSSNDVKRAFAEKKRSAAVKDLFGTLDLEMKDTKGSA